MFILSAKTDVGRVRQHNEDAVWTGFDRDGGAVAVVADGMGGAHAGEIASGLAVQSVRGHFAEKSVPSSRKAVDDLLSSAVREADAAIWNHTALAPDTIGMGTTICILHLSGETASIAWCGDSRCYLFRPSQGLKAVTKDHSFVQELVDRKALKPAQAFMHPDSHLITRCLGSPDADAEPELAHCTFRPGDVFLLCSDGLCGYCRDRQIERTLYRCYGDWDASCNALVDLALRAGGADNITVALAVSLPDGPETWRLPFRARIRRRMECMLPWRIR